MRTIPIPIRPDDDEQAIVVAIERACEAAGLVIATKGTLRAYPGSVHWHFKKGADAGTLEATYWPRERRAWLSVHGGRDADWIDQALPVILQALERT